MEMEFKEDEDSGCIVCTSHRLNKDGYLRKRVGGILVMYHRHVWEMWHHKSIPVGYEIDHMCRNRACLNPLHLQCLSNKEHTIKTNLERYSERKHKAHIEYTRCKQTGTQLSEKFGVSVSTACNWIREWAY